jgi:hypothetical protein
MAVRHCGIPQDVARTGNTNAMSIEADAELEACIDAVESVI